MNYNYELLKTPEVKCYQDFYQLFRTGTGDKTVLGLTPEGEPSGVCTLIS